jgi:hypothetical protein
METQAFTMPEHQVNIFQHGLTKNDIPVVAAQLVENILENGDPLGAAENIKVMEEIIEAVKKDKRYKDYCLEELAKHGKCYTSPRGVKIEPFNAGGRYDYKNCGDPVLPTLEIALMTAEERVEERKKFLKGIPPSGMDIRVDDELYTVYPPAPPASVSTYKVTLSKK